MHLDCAPLLATTAIHSLPSFEQQIGRKVYLHNEPTSNFIFSKKSIEHEPMVPKALLFLCTGLAFCLSTLFEMGEPLPSISEFEDQLWPNFAKGKSSNGHKNIPSTGKFHDVLERQGFQFARTATELILETAYSRSSDNRHLLYNETDLKIIIRSLDTMRGFLNMGLWSGSNADTHFIGTASCLTKLKRPAMEVALGVLHGIYLQQWRNHVFSDRECECDQRHRLQQVIGSELEQNLWRSTGLYGNGPWSSCSSTYLRLFEKENKSHELLQFLTELPLYVLLCDEVEEGMGGDGVLSGHWKRRSTENFDVLLRLAEHIGESQTLGSWVKTNQAMTHAIFRPDPVEFFVELTPPNSTVLFDTIEFNSDADAEDIAGWIEAAHILHNEQALVPPYLPAKNHQNIFDRIHDARELCDRFEGGSISDTEYLNQFETLKDKLNKCERTDDRFRKEIPIPDYPPLWALHTSLNDH